MNKKHRIYESMMRDIEERESEFEVLKRRPKTHAEIESIVFKYRDLQLSVLEEYGLTKQEQAVVFYLLLGLTYDQITKLMRLEKSTVGFHANNIFKKCHVNKRQDLCMLVLTKMYFAGSDQSSNH